MIFAYFKFQKMCDFHGQLPQTAVNSRCNMVEFDGIFYIESTRESYKSLRIHFMIRDLYYTLTGEL